MYHAFLSHVWHTGQDQMRVVKQRLLELLPDVKIFLDVDDLKEGRGQEYLDRSTLVVIFVSDGYFVSPNCMRELLRANFDQKPILALIEPEAKRGGLTQEKVQAQLQAAEGSYARWGLADEMREWPYEVPRPAMLYYSLVSTAPIEWNRIGLFQDVTLRLIANRLIAAGSGELVRDGATYVQGELTWRKPSPLKPAANGYHVYCSAANAGALQLMRELATKRNFTLRHASSPESPQRHRASQRASSGARLLGSGRGLLKLVPMPLAIGPQKTPPLHVSSRAADLPHCSHCLVYLNRWTWTSDLISAAFADEVARAMDLSVHLLLVHEMPAAPMVDDQGTEDDSSRVTLGQLARDGCDFDRFFACSEGATPAELLKRGIYRQIAVPLKGGAWREASLALLHEVLTGADTDTSGVAAESPLSRRSYRSRMMASISTTPGGTMRRGSLLSRVRDTGSIVVDELQRRCRRSSRSSTSTLSSKAGTPDVSVELSLPHEVVEASTAIDPAVVSVTAEDSARDSGA